MEVLEGLPAWMLGSVGADGVVSGEHIYIFTSGRWYVLHSCTADSGNTRQNSCAMAAAQHAERRHSTPFPTFFLPQNMNLLYLVQHLRGGQRWLEHLIHLHRKPSARLCSSDNASRVCECRKRHPNPEALGKATPNFKKDRYAVEVEQEITIGNSFERAFVTFGRYSPMRRLLPPSRASRRKTVVV